jgi:hypothetical protein
VISVVQFVRVHGDVIVRGATVVVGFVGRLDASPPANLLVISERIVLAGVACGAALTGAGVAADSLCHGDRWV